MQDYFGLIPKKLRQGGRFAARYFDAQNFYGEFYNEKLGLVEKKTV